MAALAQIGLALPLRYIVNAASGYDRLFPVNASLGRRRWATTDDAAAAHNAGWT